MGRQCFLCRKHTSKEERLHAVPKNEELQKKWMVACAMKDKQKHAVYICSKHFRGRDYKNTGCSRFLRKDAIPSLYLPLKVEVSELELDSRTVKDSDIATSPQSLRHEPSPKLVFTHSLETSDIATVGTPYHLMQHEPPDSSKVGFAPKIFALTPKMMFEPENATEESKNQRYFKDPRFVSEICIEDFATPSQANRAIQLIKNTMEKKNRTNKRLREKYHYLKKKVKSLEEVIKQLKNI